MSLWMAGLTTTNSASLRILAYSYYLIKINLAFYYSYFFLSYLDLILYASLAVIFCNY